ncbi:MAG TPA: FAD-dependent oxidoreductase [Xanthobacteraceae bacterium]|jgi:NADPH-dependent 2,4-dienoyl-CoA reductase/sulfur reductase-like enzyme
MTAARNIVVVGGGPAGVFAAINAKKQAPAAIVTLVMDEACEPYEKPPLSKAVLLGKAAPHEAPIAGPQGLAGHGVIIMREATCTAIDCSAREIAMAGGKRLSYDALVLATGSIVREIPALPLGMPRVHYLRTERHARALAAELKTSQHLVVIGGGLIGLEVASSAAVLGMRVTVIEMLPRILARVCDEETGARIAAEHRRHGVDLRVGTPLKSAQADPRGRIAITTGSGETLMADIVVVGTGAKPDDRLAAAAGIKCDNGIVVDEYCRTSDPAVFAAGDVVRFPGPHGLVRQEDWRHAQEQGAVAGRNAAGATDVYRSVPSFWSEQYDLYVQALGWPKPDAPRLRRPMSANSLLSFETDGAHITAALGINAQRDIATARRLIERSIPVDPGALADPAQPLAALLKAKA